MTQNSTTFVDMPMLSNFVHQIINPLNGVLGTLDNVVDGTTPQQKQRAQLVEVRAQLEHSIELIRNLAYLSTLSLTTGPTHLSEKQQSCTLPEIIIQAALYYQGVGRQNNIALELSNRKAQYIVQGYPALLRQVFMNLFENAVKYSDPDTKVAVTPRPQKKTGHLIVEVESYGPGFDYSERGRLFERGFRGSQALTKVASGSGLGLFISKRILELHTATIEAEYQQLTRRTLFRIRFPSFEIR